MMTADDAAQLAAFDIEDLLCQSHESRSDRLDKIKKIVAAAISRSAAAEPAKPETIISKVVVDAGPSVAKIAAAISEASQRIPQPALATAAQDEGAVQQGEDQVAQKSEVTASEAGAARADDMETDPRHSSRLAGEVASAPPPADRTIHVNKGERVLRLWAQTDLSVDQIALQAGCKKSSVSSFVCLARQAGDERGFARQTAQTAIAAIKPNDGERGPTIAGIARAVAAKPFDSPSILETPLQRIGDAVVDKPGSVVALDMTNFIVVGPLGDWKVPRPVALILERMRNGDLFDAQLLADLAPMHIEAFKAGIPSWTRRLAAIGVEFVAVKGVGCRIRLAAQ